MRWRGTRTQLGSAREPATVARLFASMFGFGSILLAATLLLPGASDRDSTGLAVLAGSGLLLALAYLAAYDRTPAWALILGPALGAALIAASVYFAGSSGSAIYGSSLALVAIASAAFFSFRVTLTHSLFAVSAYAVALLAIPGPAGLLGVKLVTAAGTLLIAAVVVSALSSQLRELVGRLADAARTDPLTGLLNRRAFDEGFEVELARSRRSRNAVSLVVIDLDHFKRFNERRGHPAGDQILRRLSDAVRDTTRGVDVVARIGGEEFAILAPETGIPGGLALAERLRRAIEVEFSGESPVLTASLGVAGSPGHGGDRTQLMKAARKALSEAKEAGRNRAVVSSVLADQPEPEPERRADDLVR